MLGTLIVIETVKISSRRTFNLSPKCGTRKFIRLSISVSAMDVSNLKTQ